MGFHRLVRAISPVLSLGTFLKYFRSTLGGFAGMGTVLIDTELRPALLSTHQSGEESRKVGPSFPHSFPTLPPLMDWPYLFSRDITTPDRPFVEQIPKLMRN